MRRITAGAVVLLLAVACSSGGDGTAPSTTVPATTLPPGTTTSSIPDRAAREVDVCELPREEELEAVLDDPGEGDATNTTPPTEDGELPPLLTGQCAWPSADDADLTLYYLAPTSAEDGASHLQDVLALDTGFAEGGSVSTVEANNQTVGILLDADGRLREVAAVARSALLYLVIEQDVDGRDPEAVQQYADLVVGALIRAPR